MKTVVILVPETGVSAAIIDPRYMFTAVNEILLSSDRQALFNVKLIGLSKSVTLADRIFSIAPDVVIKEPVDADLIIVPAISGDMANSIDMNKAFFPWMIGQYRVGAEIASLCSGAFLLAATGLLNGKPCSTHWLLANEFRTMFPDVNLQDAKIITEQNGLYSSGGANSYWNLLLHLVEKYTDRETAILAAKFFVLDINQESQSPFTIFKGQKLHNDPEIIKVQQFIETSYSARITIEELCDKFNIGRRTLERRFRKATNNSVIEYIHRVKVEASKKLLEIGSKQVSEVMVEVGYSDNKSFRDVFKRIAGLSPLDYRARYNKVPFLRT